MAPVLRSVLPACIPLVIAASALADLGGASCFNGIDDDLDGLIDCEDPDCGGEVEPVRLHVSRTDAGDGVELSWTGPDDGTVGDVAAGSLAELHAGGGGCVFDSVYGVMEHAGRSLTHPRRGTGSSWYVVRSHAPCASGDFGSDSLGRERAPGRPCHPPEVLDDCTGAPVPGELSAWTECYRVGLEHEEIHLTNLTDEPVRWLWMTCLETPRYERFDSGRWEEIEFNGCYVCPTVHSEWTELAPGEDHVSWVTWPTLDCGPLEVARAWFLVSETCTAWSVEQALAECSDIEIVATPPFLFDP